MTLFGSRTIVGTPVLSQDGHEVGEVQSLEIDIDEWRVENIEIKLKREVLEALKLKKPVFGSQSVRVTVARVSGLSEKLILKDSLENLEFVPVADP